MSDIVERLRTAWRRLAGTGILQQTTDLLSEAADEIERLRDLIPICETAKEDGLFMQINKLEAELEAERKKHEWVSVNDRLPEEWEEVIACDENAVVYPQARWFLGRKHGEIWEWAYEAGMDYWVSVDVPVTHWMPLPDPPKGEEE